MTKALAINSLTATLAVAFFFCAMSFVPVRAAECGLASYYCCEHHGRHTASSAIFDQNAMTAAMPQRRYLGQVYRVTHDGKSVTVKITDTGGFAKYDRIIDLSLGAFAKLADPRRGVVKVCLTRLR